jgi:magnesium transporter
MVVPTKDKKSENLIWCDIVAPTDDELLEISDEMDINIEDLQDCLDINERPRFNYDIIRKTNFLLIRAMKNFEIDTIAGPTFPYGLFLTQEKKLVTIYGKMMPTIEHLPDIIGRKTVMSSWHLALKIIHHMMIQMDQMSQKVAAKIKALQPTMMQSVNASDIKPPFELNNYLIFFSTATLGNANTIKSFYNRNKSVFENNPELFEKYDDVQTDIDQTHSFTGIYRDVMSNWLDAFASVINNNFTQIMKVVGSISLILMIPTLIASFYGMNVYLPGGLEPGSYLSFFIILGFSFGISLLSWKIFRKLNWL